MEVRITGKKGPDIPKEFIGLFIEDINYAVDGGLYAELLENRNFESVDVYGAQEENNDYYVKADGLYAWSAHPEEDSVKLDIVQGSPVNENNPHYLRVKTDKPGCGFGNRAYEGVYMRPQVSYHISFYARNVKYAGKLTIAIVSGERILLSRHIQVKEPDEHGWRKWEKYECDFVSNEEIRGAKFIVCLQEAGTMEFDFFSMMPEDAVCGVFRRDLAELLKELKPGFLRFPGGCIVEGATLKNRYRWKETVGSLEERKFNWNRWALHLNSEENHYHSTYAHYGQTYGIGFYEYFLLCEYLGAQPLPVLSVGLACQFQSHEKIEIEDERIREFVQDYLDLVEFANGDINSKWGAVRARMGHPAPFGLKMIGVGNEQWEDGESRFFDRYTFFEREIHKVYPEMKLIGTSGPELDSERFHAAWEFYRSHDDEQNFVYAVDEHYYIKPEWFLEHLDYFDNVSDKTKIFFGEYAAHPFGWMPMNHPEGNNLEGALAEAAFLTGALKNSDKVVMTCYAPLLARLGYAQWNPDLIWFDDRSAYRTPNYYVQQMYAQNAGDFNLQVTADGLPCQVSFDKVSRELILKLVNTQEQPKDIQLVFDDTLRVDSSAVREIVLTGKEKTDRNCIEEEPVQPVQREICLQEGKYELAPMAFTILRMPMEQIING